MSADAYAMTAVQVIDSDSNMMLDHQMILYSNRIVAEIFWDIWYIRSSNMILDNANQIVPLYRAPIGPLGALHGHKIPCIFLMSLF